MKCDVCGVDIHVVHINEKHQKVCDNCYEPAKTNDIIDKWETDPKRGPEIFI